LGTLDLGLWFPPAWLVSAGNLSALNQPSSASQKGVGCSLYQLLPDEVALPQRGAIKGVSPAFASQAQPGCGGSLRLLHGQKLKITYDVIPQTLQQTLSVGVGIGDSVVAQGLRLGSNSACFAERNPVIKIGGPAVLFVDSTSPKVTGNYGVDMVPLQAKDFFGALSFAWSIDSGAQLTTSSQTVPITFARGNAKPGTTKVHQLKVVATDSEGSTATATFAVRVYVTNKGHPL
jgi:hypothetical protein